MTWLPEVIQERMMIVLLHFLWQGLAVAAVLFLLVDLLRIKRPNVRYICSLAAFLLLTLCPIVTWFMVPVREVRPNVLPPYQFGEPIAETTDVVPRDRELPPSETISLPTHEPVWTTGNVEPFSPASPAITQVTEVAPSQELLWMNRLRTVQPWIIGAWLMGVGVLSLRLLLGAIGLWRWRRAVEALPGSLVPIVQRLCAALSMRKPQVRVCRRVVEAVAVGLFKPMILLPAAWVTDLSPEMLEAVLAHELAHVRRLDLWVNLLQRIVETLLFYHPAVWWLSRRLRVERELCCDDLAANITQDRLRYAATLEHIARLAHDSARRGDPDPAFSVAIIGRDGVLLHRIRQLLGVTIPPRANSAWLAGLLTLGLAVVIGLSSFITSNSKAEQRPLTPGDELVGNEVPNQQTTTKLSPDIAVVQNDKDAGQVLDTNPLVSVLQPAPEKALLDANGEVMPMGMAQRFGSTRFKVPGWWRRFGFAGNDEWIWIKADERVSAIHRETGRVVKHHQLRLGEGSVRALAVSPDGTQVAIGLFQLPNDADGQTNYRVVVMSALTTAHLQELKWKGQPSELSCLSFSGDGKVLLTGTQRGDVRLWNVETGRQLRQQAFEEGADLRDAALSSDGGSAVLGGWGMSFLWKIADNAGPIKLAKNRGDSVSFAPNGRVFATINSTGVRLWNGETGELVALLLSSEVSYRDADFGIAFTPDSRILAVPVASKDLIELWDVETKQRVATLPAHQPRGAAISRDGRWLAAAGQDSFTTIFDLKTRQQVNPPGDGHSQEILSVRFAGTKSLVSSSAGDARAWDVKTGQQQQTLPHESKTTIVRGLATSPDGTLIVTSAFDDTLGLWDRATGKRLFTLKGHGNRGGTRAVRFKSDGSQFVSWGDDAVLRWWNAKDGSLFAAHPLEVPGYTYQEDGRNPLDAFWLCAAFAPDTKSIFVVFEQTLSEFDTQTGKRLRQVPIPPRTKPLAVSADGRWLAAGESRRDKQGNTTSTAIVLRDRATLKVVREWPVSDPREATAAADPDRKPSVSYIAENDNGMAFSPDSRFLAWSRIDAHPGIDIVKIEHDALHASIPVESPVWCLDFAANGADLASGHADSTINVWNRWHPAFTNRPIPREGRWVPANRTVSVKVVDAKTSAPLEGVSINAIRWEGMRQHEVEASAITNAKGIAEFKGLDAMVYRLDLTATKPLPYSRPGFHSIGEMGNEAVIELERACELILKAVDSETGRGIPGVTFGRERALAEYWLQDISPDTLALAKGVGQPAEKAEPQSYITDADGVYRCLVGPATWSYSVMKFPAGYNSIVPINGRHELEIETPSGGRVEYTFQLVKAPAAGPALAPVDPNGEIHGQLLDEMNAPVVGATIACGAVINDSLTGGGSNAVTDAAGRYRLSVPSPGIYNVWLKKFDKDRTMTAAFDDGLLVEGGKVTTSQLRLVKGRKVVGKVVDAGKPIANIRVNCNSLAWPQADTTKDDGSFEFALPPGRTRLYVHELVAKSDDNPFGLGRYADIQFEVSATEEVAPIMLSLKKSEAKFGDPIWLNRSTPGTQIVRHQNADDVTGTVVDADGKPIAGAKVFREDGPMNVTDDQGKFQVKIEKGTQFVMHAFAPGYHVWFGTPTAGDVLKIVMEKKKVGAKVPPVAVSHVAEIRLVGGPKNEPLPNVKVEFTSGEGSDRKSFGTFTTDNAGWLKATLPVGFYNLKLSSEKEWPYLTFEKAWTGSSFGHSKQLNVRVTESAVEKWLDGNRRENGFEAATQERPARITFTLEPAVELVFRALDIESGKGIAGADFYEEVAVAEDWAHSIYGNNLGSRFAYGSKATAETENLTDKEGYLRRWVGEKSEESKFGIWKAPAGYELVEPKGEIPVVTKLGQERVEQVFKFRRIRWVVTIEPEKKQVMLGEPLWLTFKVKNATNETRGLELGGDYRNRFGRPETFDVTIINNDAKKMPIPDAGFSMGGISSNVLLKPNGETKVSLFLSDWATIAQPGNYRVFVKRPLKLFPVKEQNGDRVAWGETPETVTVEARCEFDVVPPDAEKFGVLIEQLGRDLTENLENGRYTKPPVRETNESFKMLRSIHDERTVPIYLRLLKDSHFINKQRACDGLAPYGSDAAFNGLKDALRTTASDISHTSAALAESTTDSIHHWAALALTQSPHPAASDFVLTLANHRSEAVRITVLHHARKLSPMNADAVKVIGQMTTDTNQRVSDEAKRYQQQLTDEAAKETKVTDPRRDTWGPEDHGLRTRLFVTSEKHAVGQPLKLSCELKNFGSVVRMINPQGADWCRGLEVIGPDGKRCEFLPAPFSTFANDVELKPGESRMMFEEVDVASLFLMPTAGEYTLRLNGGDKARFGEIEEGQRTPIPPPSDVKIMLAAGKLPPIQTLFLKLRPLAPKDWSVNLFGQMIHFTGPGPGKLAPFGTEPTTVQLWFLETELFQAEEKARTAQFPNEKFPQLHRLGKTRLGFGHLTATGPALTQWPKCVEQIRQAVAAADTAHPSERGEQTIPPILEFRIVAQRPNSQFEPRVPADFEKRSYSGNTAIGRMVAKDKGFVWVPVAEAKDIIPAMPVERPLASQSREALLADTSEHALAWNGKWGVETCRVVADPNGDSRFMIELTLDEAGGEAMQTLTKSHLNQSLAIVVNDQIVAVPIIRSEIGRQIAITGNFNREQADKLAKYLSAPAARRQIRGKNEGGEGPPPVPRKDIGIETKTPPTTQGKKLGIPMTRPQPDVESELKSDVPPTLGKPGSPFPSPDTPAPKKLTPALPSPYLPGTPSTQTESGYPIVQQNEGELADGWIACEFGLQYRIRTETTSLVAGELPLIFVDIRNRGTFEDMGLELHQSQHALVIDGKRYERRDQPWGGVTPLEREGKPLTMAFALSDDWKSDDETKTSLRLALGKHRIALSLMISPVYPSPYQPQTTPISRKPIARSLICRPIEIEVRAGAWSGPPGSLGLENIRREVLALPDFHSPKVPTNLRRLVQEHQPAAGDYLVKLIKSGDPHLQQAAAIVFADAWDSMNHNQIENYLLATMTHVVRQRRQYPQGLDAKIGMTTRLRPSYLGVPTDQKYQVEIATTHFLDDQQVDEPFVNRDLGEQTFWIKTKELPLGKHRLRLATTFAFTRGTETYRGAYESPEFTFEIVSNDTPDDLIAPHDEQLDRLVRASLVIAETDHDLDHPPGSDTNNGSVEPEASESEKWHPQLGYGENKLGITNLHVPVWKISKRLPVDLCFAVDFLIDNTDTRIHCNDVVSLMVEGEQRSYFSPQEFYPLAAMLKHADADGFVTGRLVLKGSRSAALSNPKVNRYYGGEITSPPIRFKISAVQLPNKQKKPANDDEQNKTGGPTAPKPDQPSPTDDSKNTRPNKPDDPNASNENKGTFGTLSGRFTYDGEPPATADQSLMVGKDGGVANVVLWVVSKDIPWTPLNEALSPVAIRLKDGNASPRIAVVTVGQPLLIENHTPLVQTFGADFARALNPPVSLTLQPGADTPPPQLTFRAAEPYPAHYWFGRAPGTSGRLFVHGNPFVAVSRPDGSFSLPNLPLGEWEFQVFHERGGYIRHWPQGRFKLAIKLGENNLGTIKLKSEHLGQRAVAAPPPKNREQIGEVLGKPIYRDQVIDESLHALVLGPVWAKYREAHRDAITPTADELKLATTYFDQEHRKRIENEGGESKIREQLKGLEAQLVRAGLSEDDEKKLELEHLGLRQKLKSPSSYGFAQFMLNNWKFQKHLYDEFGGGRVLWQQAGLEAFDATRVCLESFEKQGEFKLTDAKLRTKLYEYWMRENHPGLFSDKEIIRREFIEPKWLAPAVAKTPDVAE